MFLTFLTESFQSYSLVSVLGVIVVIFLFILRPDGVNKEQTQVSTVFRLDRSLEKSKKEGGKDHIVQTLFEAFFFIRASFGVQRRPNMFIICDLVSRELNTMRI